MKAYAALVDRALELGFSVLVLDEEGPLMKPSRDVKQIVRCIKSVDLAQLVFIGPSGQQVGWAAVSDTVDLADDENVIDCSASVDWINDVMATL
jgi:hypothetical protein